MCRGGCGRGWRCSYLVGFEGDGGSPILGGGQVLRLCSGRSWGAKVKGGKRGRTDEEVF